MVRPFLCDGGVATLADDDKDSKTEDPTAKKKTDAADKGNVPFSRELPLFATVLATFVYLIFFLPKGLSRTSESLQGHFRTAGSVEARYRSGCALVVRPPGLGFASLLAPA
jgi:flagellar biosynthetic protein FlhB